MTIHPTSASRLARHVKDLHACRLCPRMHAPPVSGGPVLSPVMLVGQAPGDKEPKLGRPFAWTAGRTLFKWFEEAAGLDEAGFRERIYMAAVCRCFPGKKSSGGDRVPDREEIETCSRWLSAEIGLLAPRLVLPVGKLAIEQFVPYTRLDDLVGRTIRVARQGHEFDVIPLPHPSGASPWPRIEPGKTLVAEALRRVVRHAAFLEAVGTRPARSKEPRSTKMPKSDAIERSTRTPNSGAALNSTNAPRSDAAPKSTKAPKSGTAPSSTNAPRLRTAPKSTKAPRSRTAPKSANEPKSSKLRSARARAGARKKPDSGRRGR